MWPIGSNRWSQKSISKAVGSLLMKTGILPIVGQVVQARSWNNYSLVPLTVWVITWLSAALWYSYKCCSQKLLIQVTQCHLCKCHCPLAQVQAIDNYASNIPDCLG